jgi:hypothetical protein
MLFIVDTKSFQWDTSASNLCHLLSWLPWVICMPVNPCSRADKLPSDVSMPGHFSTHTRCRVQMVDRAILSSVQVRQAPILGKTWQALQGMAIAAGPWRLQPPGSA